VRAAATRISGGLVVVCALSGLAAADSITVNGQRVDNVLVTKTSSFYYVQLPGEGRTLNFPVESVEPGAVKINDDAFYRDKLKEEYKKNKELRDAGQEIEVDPAFRAGPGDSVGGDGSAAPAQSGGAAAGGLGVPRTQVEAALAGFGLAFQPGSGRGGQPSVVAQMPDGSRVELVGPPEQLFGIVASGTGAPAQINMMMTQLQMLVTQLQPAAAGEMQGLVQESKESGSARRSVGGVTLSLTQSQQGENATVEFQMLAGG
jgi:catechol 2,3-dioxygenase-like lactoylglutathione lyase family enzyme